MNEEYAGLRNEILQWQAARFVILGLTVTIAVALTGVLISNEVDFEAQLNVISLVYFLVAFSCLLSWYAGFSNTVIASYIIVFHETGREGWEKNLILFNNKFSEKFNLNFLISLIYLVISFSIGLLIWHENLDLIKPTWQIGLHFISILFLIFSLIFMAFYSYPREKYIEKWKEIFKENQGMI